MRSEDTIFNDDHTMFDSNEDMFNESEVNQEKLEETPKSKKGVIIGGVAAGLGAGILLGSVSTFAADKMLGAQEEETPEEGEQEQQEAEDIVETHVPAAYGNVPVASNVNDDVSFSEAFEEAREEIGPGGAFIWNGNVYSTFTAAEWNAMTQEERDEYNSNFAWGSNDDEMSDLDQETQTPGAEEVEVEVVDVKPEDVAGQDDPGLQQEVEVVQVVDEPYVEPEVEILGVVEDPETGAVIGGMTVDGHDVYLIDVDPDVYGDNEFDIMVADIDGDGVITESEIVDITSEHVGVEEFAAEAYGADPMYAMNDEGPDYINDADVDSYDIV